jgi:hypothetical protein
MDADIGTPDDPDFTDYFVFFYNLEDAVLLKR